LKSNNYIELLKFGLQEKKGKEKQTKLRTWNLKKKYQGIKLSGFQPRELHQSKLNHKKLKWYTWENPKPSKGA
jgi:hypothetical protein